MTTTKTAKSDATSPTPSPKACQPRATLRRLPRRLRPLLPPAQRKGRGKSIMPSPSGGSPRPGGAGGTPPLFRHISFYGHRAFHVLAGPCESITPRTAVKAQTAAPRDDLGHILAIPAAL